MTYLNNRISHKKELYYILCIVAVVVILLFSFFAPGGYLELRRARIELQEQNKRVDELKRSNYERRKSIEALRSDRDALEKEARKKGYGREDEIVQQLPQKPDK
jgi:cell division protein FtsB